MAKLSKEQWAEARARWESDPRAGFEWLAVEIGVSRPAVSKMASTHGWEKGGDVAKVTPSKKVTQVTQKKTEKVTQTVTQPRQPVTPAQAKRPAPAASNKPESPQWEVMEKRPRGRPTEYKDEYIQLMIDYFNIEVEKLVDVEVVGKDGEVRTEQKVVVNKFPTLGRFASNIGITRETLHDWATAKNPDGSIRRPDFAYTYARAKDLQEVLLTEGGLAGMYEGRFATFAAKNIIGWRDKIDVDSSAEISITSKQSLEEKFALKMRAAHDRMKVVMEERQLLSGDK